MEASRNVSTYLVIVHGHFHVTLFSFCSRVSWLGVWSLQKETELSSHMIPFLSPVYWHLKLCFSEIFD